MKKEVIPFSLLRVDLNHKYGYNFKLKNREHHLSYNIWSYNYEKSRSGY